MTMSKWRIPSAFLGADLCAMAASDKGDKPEKYERHPKPNPIAALIVSSDSFLERCSESRLVHRSVDGINTFLDIVGVPVKHHSTSEEVVLFIFATVVTLVSYFFLFGKRHGRRRKKLEEELLLSQLQVHHLKEKLLLAKAEEISSSVNRGRAASNGEVRIFMDGAFDMMHYGHMNAFRLARSLGTRLIVGINSDDSITKCKGPPLMNDQERLTMVQGCKFVDEVVPGCPYVMNAKYLQYIIERFDVDYVVHGDDPCIVDGKDVYEAAKLAGKYQSIPRTEGVSTTDIVGRMLTMTKEHHCPVDGDGDDASVTSMASVTAASLGGAHGDGRPMCEQSKFLTTSRMLRLFSAGTKAPEKGMKVVYMDGAWDMFHCGHVAVLKEAKQRGDYLIVGVHSDYIVNKVRGSNLPLMNLHERVLSVMGCRYVDDVLIDAPYRITPEMVASLGISEVMHGSCSDDVGEGHVDEGGENGEVLNGDDRSKRYGHRYQYPRESGIFRVISSPTDFNLGNIVDRIQKSQEVFQKKISRKKKAESDYYNQKYGMENKKDGTQQ